jgi:futalosine hydrolase
MNILLVSATELEIKPIILASDKTVIVSPFLRTGRYFTHKLSILVTGIGMVNTAMQLSPVLAQNKYDIVIQAGIAGSYSQKYDLGSVIEIIQENYADLGAENNDGTLLDLQKLGFTSLTDANKNLYFNTFQNPDYSQIAVPKVVSNTVNLCSGTETTIQNRLRYFPAETENMEGAAFFQTCIQYQQRFYAFRTISNYVEPRNTSQWNIPLAIQKLSVFIQELLHKPVL